MQNFIEKYFSKYLEMCQERNPFVEGEKFVHMPPTGEQLAELMAYLQEKGADPVIVGTLAVIKYMNITEKDIRSRYYRPMAKLELIISQLPSEPLMGWVNKSSSRKVTWISPSEGFVEFMLEREISSDNTVNLSEIGKDAESVVMGCPVADLPTLFKMKLDSEKGKDLAELLLLAQKTDILKQIENQSLTTRQRKKLEVVKRWSKYKH